jgi:hypothetical protein
MSNGTKAYGSIIAWSTTENGSYTAVAQSKDLAGPSPEIGDIDMTNNDSPNNTKEYYPGGGLIEPGELEFQLIYEKGQCDDLYTTFGDGIGYWYRETFPDGSQWKFPGYIKGFGTEGETDDGLFENNITLKLTGKPVFTPGT